MNADIWIARAIALAGVVCIWALTIMFVYSIYMVATLGTCKS